MGRGRSSFFLLYRYTARTFLLCFAASFLFFFFIFFVNQILVLAKEILLKNVPVGTVLRLVVLTIPQFLLYTFPFSSLAAASIAIGDLSSRNEILAMRFSGINMRRVFVPIVAISLLLSLSAIAISDRLIPHTSQAYKKEYSKILSDIPTVEIESYKVSNINNLILSTGEVQGSRIRDIAIFDAASRGEASAIAADEGEIRLLDIGSYSYELALDHPTMLTTSGGSIDSWGLSRADSMRLNLDFSNLIPSVQSLQPSQMSLKQLREKAAERDADNDAAVMAECASRARDLQTLSDAIHGVRTGEWDQDASERTLASLADDARTWSRKPRSNFYLQYYKSEFHKKLALSMACTFLVFIAFPISFFKVRYGRLIGFAMSIMVSAVYWFGLFFLQVACVETAIEPALLIWIPNLAFFLAGVVLIGRLGRL